jgi:hypothetical protein
MSKLYEYRRKGVKYGPVTGIEVRRLAAAGQIGPDDLIRTVGADGEGKWVRAGSVRGLQFAESSPTIPEAIRIVTDPPTSEQRRHTHADHQANKTRPGSLSQLAERDPFAEIAIKPSRPASPQIEKKIDVSEYLLAALWGYLAYQWAFFVGWACVYILMGGRVFRQPPLFVALFAGLVNLSVLGASIYIRSFRKRACIALLVTVPFLINIGIAVTKSKRSPGRLSADFDGREQIQAVIWNRSLLKHGIEPPLGGGADPGPSILYAAQAWLEARGRTGARTHQLGRDGAGAPRRARCTRYASAADVIGQGSVTAVIEAGTLATAEAGKNLAGSVTAGTDINVQAGGTVTGTVKAGSASNISALDGNVDATVTAGTDASVLASGNITQAVTARGLLGGIRPGGRERQLQGRRQGVGHSLGLALPERERRLGGQCLRRP